MTDPYQDHAARRRAAQTIADREAGRLKLKKKAPKYLCQRLLARIGAAPMPDHREYGLNHGEASYLASIVERVYPELAAELERELGAPVAPVADVVPLGAAREGPLAALFRRGGDDAA